METAVMLPKILPRSPEEKQAALERKLMRKEAQIGGRLFGPVPKGHNRQFFCLDEHTWVWHEEWIDKTGTRKVVTTQYDVRPSGILKLQNGRVYQRLSREETRNLYLITQLYHQRVGAFYDQILQLA
jgi:hypothetical protein